MGDFTKEKIAFAVALLAVLFTIMPLLTDFGSVGFVLFGFNITFRLLYYVLSTLLALSVYCYGVQFAFQRFRRMLTTIGDALYAVAIVSPVAFALLFIGTEFATVLGDLLRSEKATSVATGITGVLVGAASTYLALRTQRELAARQREAEVISFANQSVVQLRRAEQLHRSGHHDLAVIEAFRAVEFAARRTAVERGQSLGPLWSEAVLRLLPTDELREGFEDLRRVRNMATHAIEPVTTEQARRSLAVASRILSFLSGSDST